jgi:hypothetical protein
VGVIAVATIERSKSGGLAQRIETHTCSVQADVRKRESYKSDVRVEPFRYTIGESTAHSAGLTRPAQGVFVATLSVAREQSMARERANIVLCSSTRRCYDV